MTFRKYYINVSECAAVIGLILILYWLWKRRHLYAFAMRFPGKFGLPILGLLLEIRNIDYLLPVCAKLFRCCKADTFLTWCGTYPVLISRDPVVVEKILSSTTLLTKANPMYVALNDALQGGIITSPASEWKIHRKMINPVFKHKVLLSFFPIFNRAKNNLIKKFEDLSKSNEYYKVNGSAVIQTMMVRVASETVMGTQRKMEDSDIHKYVGPYVDVFKVVANLTVCAYLNIFKVVKFIWIYRNITKIFDHFMTELLEERLEKEKDKLVNYEISEDKPTIFIDLVFDYYRKGKLSWQNVISESNTMLMASIETTSNALFSTIVMLAMHPPVQKRLYEELMTIYSDNDIDVEYEHLSKLPYLEMVVQETLRLMPSIPMIGRQSTEPIEIGEGVIVPKGVQIMLSIYHIHRNHSIWGPNAEKFDPENFLPERTAKRHSHAYIPFSKGLRNCIGYRYAIFSLKIFLIGLICNYKFETDFKYDDLELLNYVSLAYKREPSIKMIARKGQSL